MGKTKTQISSTAAVLKQIEKLLANLEEGEVVEFSLEKAASGHVQLTSQHQAKQAELTGKRVFGKFKGEITLCSEEQERAFDDELEKLFYGENE